MVPRFTQVLTNVGIFSEYYSPLRVDMLFKWTKNFLNEYETGMSKLIGEMRGRIERKGEVTSELQNKLYSQKFVENVKFQVITK